VTAQQRRRWRWRLLFSNVLLVVCIINLAQFLVVALRTQWHAPLWEVVLSIALALLAIGNYLALTVEYRNLRRQMMGE
jgi:uncharacterized integral membrane protein